MNCLHASSAGLTQIRFEGLPYGSQPKHPMCSDTPGGDTFLKRIWNGAYAMPSLLVKKDGR